MRKQVPIPTVNGEPVGGEAQGVSGVSERLGLWAFRRRSYLPLLLVPFLVLAIVTGEPIDPSEPTARDGLAVGLATAGLLVRVVVAGHVPRRTSGRRTDGCQAEELNTSGLYSLVRHPLYAGNILATLAVAIIPGAWWLIVVFAVFLLVHYGLIMAAEDSFLRRQFGETHRQWARSTPALIPDFRSWRPWSLPFCIRTAIRREYPGWFAAAAAIPAVKLLQSLRAGRAFDLAPGWISVAVLGAVVFLVVRTLKHHTRLLHVPGR